MKQILQNLKSGKTEMVEVPYPQLKTEHLLVKSKLSLISSGTERMLVEFGKASYLAKAKNQPEKVKQVLNKIKTDGLIPTIEAVKSKLDQPLPLGYNNVGTVVEVESSKVKAQSLKVGNRVVSNGSHAEVVCVPRNFCQKIPDNVSDEEAAFTIVGAIGLQGIRLAQPTLGELFVVTGLGLIGQLTMQLLMAHGCEVIGIDYDSSKCKFAKNFGAKVVDLSKGEDPVESGMNISQGIGVDGVIITASTKSSEPIHQAAQMCRKRGRIILVGVTGLDIRRSDFQDKELTFQVSNSYGPGRYDPQYEEKGHDYPLGYVRWTAQRNFQAFLHLLETRKLDINPLITHRFSFEEAPKAYDLITKDNEKYLGIILDYEKKDVSRKDAKKEKDTRITQTLKENEKTGRLEGEGTEDKCQKSDDRSRKTDVGSEQTVRLKEPILQTSKFKLETLSPVIGLIGAGNFTGQVLLPALQKTGGRLKVICSSGGVTGTHLGKKFGIEESTTDVERIFADSEINTVFVTTRHNTHARLVMKALKAGKNVFVEKPLCLTLNELDKIKDYYSLKFRNQNSQLPLLMVGFNRRFAPHVVRMKELLNTVREPKSIIMTVNAGMIPIDHWTQDAEVGGGRIIGEACHFIDLLRFLAGAKIVKHDKSVMKSLTGDTLSINLSFADGSIGSIHYFANGDKAFPKESIDIFCGGKILHLNNFKMLRGFGWKKFKKLKLWKQDKGHYNETQAFVESIIQGKPNPIPFEEIVEVMRTTLQIAF